MAKQKKDKTKQKKQTNKRIKLRAHSISTKELKKEVLVVDIVCLPMFVL